MIVHAEVRQYCTEDEYLEQEVQSEERHEYLDGEVVCVAGATPNHNQIVLNLSRALNLALRRQPYRVFAPDQRLWIPSRRIYTYPDVMVMTQPLEYREGRWDTLLNPLIIAEVLSSLTKNYDYGEKFAAYRTIPSFQEYVLLDQDRLQVGHYVKSDPKRWIFSELDEPNEILSLETLSFQISLADLYDQVEFEPEVFADPTDSINV